MIKKMRKVQIIGPKGELDRAIRALHAMAVVHIEAFTPGNGEGEFLRRIPIEREKALERERLERAAERLRNLRAILPQPAHPERLRIAPEDIERNLSALTDVEERARGLRASKDRLSEELSALDKYERLLRAFAPMVSRLGGLKNFEITGLTLERTREDIAGLLEAEAARVTGGAYQLFSKELDERTLGIVLTYPKAFAPEVRTLLSGRSISEVRLPDEYSELALIEALMLMGRRKASLPALIRDAESGLASISSQWHETIAATERAVLDALEEIGAVAYASATRFAFIVEGWVPSDDFERLRAGLASEFGERVHLRSIAIEAGEMDSVPVCISNPRPLKPFEVFLSALPPPKYGSIDPTPFVALFFPAFFGLIVADMGYGALMLAAAVYLRRRLKARKPLRDIATVVAASAASAVFFGLLFGEFFGDLGERLGLLHPVLMNRVEALSTLISVTIGIGIGHVCLGISLSVVNKAARGHAREALARLTYLALVVAAVAAAGAVMGVLPRPVLPWAVGAALAAFVALALLEGVLGPIEFAEALGNIVSYVRIMAVGTASVVMAMVANQMGSIAGGAALGMAAAALLHALNLLLSVMSPSIQSMRLQYVEFFGKFYEGGGRRYAPFRRN